MLSKDISSPYSELPFMLIKREQIMLKKEFIDKSSKEKEGKENVPDTLSGAQGHVLVRQKIRWRSYAVTFASGAGAVTSVSATFASGAGAVASGSATFASGAGTFASVEGAGTGVG